MRWKKSYPTQSHKISQIPAIMQDNFDALEDTIILEHSGSMTATSVSGVHTVATTSVSSDAALPGIMFEGPFTSLSSLTPSAGALAHDTTYGKIRLCSGGVWSVTQSGCVARAWASSGYNAESTLITADYVIGGLNPAVQIAYDKNFDAADEQTFDNFHDGTAMSAFDISGTFTAPSSGMYIMIIGMTTVGSGVEVASAVCTADSQATTVAFAWTPSANGQTLASQAGHNVAHINDTDWTIPDDTDFNMWPGKRTTYEDSFLYSSTEAISSNLGENATSVQVTIVARARQVGCGCHLACYGQAGGCKNCYGTHTCACNKSCYGYSACSCNLTCYGYSAEGCGSEGCGGEGCGGDTCDSCGGDVCDSSGDEADGGSMGGEE